MSISELGSLGEFIGSIAVLITLVYLVYQIRQNTLSIKSQSRYFVLDALNRDARQAQDEDFDQLFDIVQKGSAPPDALRRYTFVLVAWWSNQELLFYEIRDGALPKQFEETLKFRVRSTFANARANDVWKGLRGYYTKDFQEYVDQLRDERDGGVGRVRGDLFGTLGYQS